MHRSCPSRGSFSSLQGSVSKDSSSPGRREASTADSTLPGTHPCSKGLATSLESCSIRCRSSRTFLRFWAARLLGRTLLNRCHVGAEDRIHAGLVPRSLSLEPREDILVDSEGNWLLRSGVNERSTREKVSRKISEFRRRSTLNRALRGLSKASKVSPTAARFVTLARGLGSMLGAHEDCSIGPR
jgi:hypothetical protein